MSRYPIVPSLFTTMIMSFKPDTEFLDADPKKNLVHKMKSIVTTLVSPPCLAKLVFPTGFSNQRLTYLNTDDLSTRYFNTIVVNAIATIHDCIQEDYDVKAHGVIILSMLDLFTYHGGSVLVSQGNLARVNRFVCSLLDTIMVHSNYKTVVIMPYIYKKDTDLPRLQTFEHKLQEAVCMDQDLQGHIFSRIRFFSILKNCLDFQNAAGPNTGHPLMNQFNDDRYFLTSDGYNYISARLSEDIANWADTIYHTKLNVPQPLSYTQDRLEAVTKQLFQIPMVTNPKDVKKPKPVSKKPAPEDPNKSTGPGPQVLTESDRNIPKAPLTSQKTKNNQSLPDPAPKKVKQNPETESSSKNPAPIAPKNKSRSKKNRAKRSDPRINSHMPDPYSVHQGYPWFHPSAYTPLPPRPPYRFY